jgi:hypothetical protein
MPKAGLMTDLEIEFTKAAMHNASLVEASGLPRRSRWLSAISTHGSAKLAWEAQSSGYSDGFTDLCMAGLHRLTVEYLILQPRFAVLFTADQRREACALLREYCGGRFSEEVDQDGFLTPAEDGHLMDGAS